MKQHEDVEKTFYALDLEFNLPAIGWTEVIVLDEKTWNDSLCRQSQSIFKRSLENALKAITYSITVDFQTLEDQKVTIIDRDTEEQPHCPIDKLLETIDNKFRNY